MHQSHMVCCRAGQLFFASLVPLMKALMIEVYHEFQYQSL